MNLITSGVMNGLMGASSLIQLTKVPMAVYSLEAAKQNPNQAVLERSSGYAGDTMTEAMEETKKAGDELQKAKIEAAAQEKAENAAKLEQAGKEKPSKVDESNDTTVKQPVDTIVISEEGKLAISNETANKVPQTEVTDAPANTENVQAAAIEPKVYSSSGKVAAIVVNVQHKISVRA